VGTIMAAQLGKPGAWARQAQPLLGHIRANPDSSDCGNNGKMDAGHGGRPRTWTLDLSRV